MKENLAYLVGGIIFIGMCASIIFAAAGNPLWGLLALACFLTLCAGEATDWTFRRRR